MSGIEVRQLAVATMAAAADGRLADIPVILADATREELILAAGGLAIAVGCVLDTLPAQQRAAAREQYSRWALDLAARTAAG